MTWNICQWHIQAVWEPSIPVWAPKKGFLTFNLKIFFKHLCNLENVLQRNLRTGMARECIFGASGGTRFKIFHQPWWRKGGGGTPRCNWSAQKNSGYITVSICLLGILFSLIGISYFHIVAKIQIQVFWQLRVRLNRSWFVIRHFLDQFGHCFIVFGRI